MSKRIDTSNNADVRRIFENVNMLVSGERLVNSAAALQDLYVAVICFAMDSKAEVHEFFDAAIKDMHATVDKNFDHYRAQRGEHHNAPAGRA